MLNVAEIKKKKTLKKKAKEKERFGCRETC